MDYYTVLGVDRNVTPQDLKRAYKRLASKHHPDKGGDAEQFKRLQEAYATLSDPVKRQEYDSPDPDPWQFSGGHNPFQRPNYGNVRNPDGITHVTISLAQAHTGTDVLIDVGYSREVLTVHAGIQDQAKFRLRGKGPNRFKHAEPGDLIVIVSIDMPQGLTRTGNNITQDVKVDSLTAITGGFLTVQHFTGKTVKVKIPANTQQGAKLKLAAYGIADQHTGWPGDMIVKVDLYTPLITDPKHIEALNTVKQEVLDE